MPIIKSILYVHTYLQNHNIRYVIIITRCTCAVLRSLFVNEFVFENTRVIR